MTDKSLILVLLIGVVSYSGWTAFVVATDRPVDYYTYAIAAYAFTHGIDIYATPEEGYDPIATRLGITVFMTPYLYPPLTAMVVWPLTLIPLHEGAAVWIFSSGLAALGAGLLLGARADSAWKKRLILIASIGFAPTLASMYLGQVNVFVLLLTVYALRSWRRNSNAKGGGFLAAGIWLKPLAVVEVGLLVWRGRWKALAGVLAASLIVIFASVVAFGSKVILDQLKPYQSILQPTVDPSVAGSSWPGNQNLFSLLSRLLTPNEFGPSLMNSPQLVLITYWILAVAFVAGALALLWPFGLDLRYFELEFALLLTTTLLLSPITQIHHLTVAFIPFALLIERQQTWKRLNWYMLLSGAAYAMMNIQTVLLQQRVFGNLLLLDLATWAEVIIWGLLAIELPNRHRGFLIGPISGSGLFQQLG